MPDRSAAVAKWLSTRPDAPTKHLGKAYAWSHMAGWYADQGCERFYRVVWEQDELAQALENQLAKLGAIEIMRSVAR